MAHRNVQGYRTILSRRECWQIRAIDHPDEMHKRCILKEGESGNHLLNIPATLSQQSNHHNILQKTLHRRSQRKNCSLEQLPLLRLSFDKFQSKMDASENICLNIRFGVKIGGNLAEITPKLTFEYSDEYSLTRDDIIVSSKEDLKLNLNFCVLVKLLLRVYLTAGVHINFQSTSKARSAVVVFSTELVELIKL
uniref:Uncharacterized protein n=1 Tax=Glossina austeni TaxID=7395 RepID=A0A1A9UWQ5_GLOAU